MSKYLVIQEVTVSIEVEANNVDEARDKAFSIPIDEWDNVDVTDFSITEHTDW